jgi:hypothetical protein
MDRRFLLGCDLARSLDFTSFAVIEMDEDLDGPIYHLRGLDRIKGVDYPKIVELIAATIKRLDKEKNTIDGPHLCMDASGLGAPVRDYLIEADIFTDQKEIFPVVFTGGEAARYDTVSHNYNISKTLIVSNLLSLMQHRRFDYSPDLQALSLLEREISSFKYHLTPSGHTGFDAESGEHDDLICAIAIPLIVGEWKFKIETIRGLTFVAIPKRRPLTYHGL